MKQNPQNIKEYRLAIFRSIIATCTLYLFAHCGVPLVAQNILLKNAHLLTRPPVYVSYKAEERIKIDGKLNELSWKQAEPTDPFVDISGVGFPAPKYETNVKILWDDNYLYIGAMLEEENIVAKLKQRDTIVWRDNDFEVFIDPDGDGQNYFEIETNARGTVLDLLMNKPYRSNGDFLIPWDCAGLKLAIHRAGTLNNASDTDKYWSVEMAIPHQSLKLNFAKPPKSGDYWRINFSRVQWSTTSQHEQNWVWSPTGKIDMHMPDRWGYLYFSDNQIGTTKETFDLPYHNKVYQLLWAMFYTQQTHHSTKQNYLRTKQDFFLSESDLIGLPENAEIDVEATSQSFLIAISLPNLQTRYTVDQNGRFATEKIAPKSVKNWIWTRINKQKSETDYQKWFALLKECGISAVLFEGYDETLFRLCKDAGLEAHYWMWTMNRSELLTTHPEWFAVNRKGESSYNKPAYVDYYRFLCPNQDGVAEYLASDYLRIARLPHVDGVHLDYVRYPDVVLPVSLWGNYGIEQTRELPEYDYCYCEVCRNKFKEKTGRDPLLVEYPMEDQSWIHFRMESITQIVDRITRTIKTDDKSISAAVFPGPSMAKKMVRQDWGNWSLDAYFPMIYNGFYNEEYNWIGTSVKESVQTINHRAPIYAGLMFPDIKKDFEKALDAAFNNGASGVSFFDGPDQEYLYRLKKYLKERDYHPQ